MNRLVGGVVLAAVVTVTLVAQTKPPCDGPLSVAQVAHLLAQRSSQRRIVTSIDTCGVSFELTAEREEVLRAVFGTDAVMAAVRKASDKLVAERNAAQEVERQRQRAADAARLEAAEEEEWRVVKDSLDVSVVEAYLATHQEGSHATDARRRLDDLRPKSASAVTDDRGLTWVLIPAGTFAMGCTAGDSECYEDEKPAHQVTLTRPYWMMTTEVTLGQYRAAGVVMPTQPDWNTDERQPVANVTWDQAASLCRAAGARLPTEAEWEFAARGGSGDTAYVWGSDQAPLVNGRRAANVADVTATRKYATEAMFKDYDDGFAESAPVGVFAANGYGLFDMAGNVWEWVSDWYDAGYYRPSASKDPKGPKSGQGHVTRGGSWGNAPRSLRVSVRAMGMPTFRSSTGFRCAKDFKP
jgi:formylglycine-generating enzyme required for sulfatase activity